MGRNLRLKGRLAGHVAAVDEKCLASGEAGLADEEVAIGGRQFLRQADARHGHTVDVAGPAFTARRIVGCRNT